MRSHPELPSSTDWNERRTPRQRDLGTLCRLTAPVILALGSLNEDGTIITPVFKVSEAGAAFQFTFNLLNLINSHGTLGMINRIPLDDTGEPGYKAVSYVLSRYRQWPQARLKISKIAVTHPFLGVDVQNLDETEQDRLMDEHLTRVEESLPDQVTLGLDLVNRKEVLDLVSDVKSCLKFIDTGRI